MRNIDPFAGDDPAGNGRVKVLQIVDRVGAGITPALAVAEHHDVARRIQLRRDAFAKGAVLGVVPAVMFVDALALLEPA